MSAPTLQTTTGNIREAARLVTAHYYGEHGLWAYHAFDWVNHTLYDDELPDTLIVIGLTAHGACLGKTHCSAAPVITLHPSLWGGTETDNPWKIPPDLLGPRYAFDCLIHESIHVSVECRLGGWRGTGESSHNNRLWAGEVNRIAPLIGLHGVTAAINKPVRRGKRIVRESQGNIGIACHFPYDARGYLAQFDYYRNSSPLPFE